MTLNLKKRVYTSILLILITLLIFKNDFVLIYSLLLLGVMSIIEFLNLTDKIFKNFFYKLVSNSIFIFYISLFFILCSYFFNFPQLKIILFIILSGCVASDLGGYIFGNIFKGPKLTKISPNKTISGALGSILLTCITVLTLFFFLVEAFSFYIFIIGLIISISCQLGDLAFSFIKRKAKTKDTGKFFPGHGGVLDRLDSILLGMPVGFLSLIFFLK
tara:strand:+ start:2932 stop:3582 length:651 start_codon:yes stop_codon:yes gene_type:complete